MPEAVRMKPTEAWAVHYGPGIYRAIQVDMGTGRRWTSTAWACGRDLGGDVMPTYWQPLPAPPAASGPKDKP